MIFSIIGQNVSNPNWTGAGTTLKYHDSVTMPQTPNGSMILAWWNLDSQNNDGTLALTSGGNPPQFLDAPQGALLPSNLVQNFQANNLQLTNISPNSATTIRVAAFGPGIPGQSPRPLAVGGTVQLSTLQAAQGKAPPNYAQLQFQNNTSNLCIISVIGGPADGSGNNAYLFALNYQGPPNPQGYTRTTSGNSLTCNFNWTTSVYVANMSPSTSSSVAVTLISV